MAAKHPRRRFDDCYDDYRDRVRKVYGDADEQRLDGKVAIVTGGGSGIGQATAQLFAEEGAQVVIFEIDAEAAAETFELHQWGIPCQPNRGRYRRFRS